MALLDHLAGVRSNALTLATIAYLNLAAAKNLVDYTDLDDLQDGCHTPQLQYERGRGMLDAIQEMCWPILGEADTRALLAEAAKTVGYEPIKANAIQVHAGAHLATVPSKTSYTQTHQSGTYIKGASGTQQSFPPSHPLSDATDDWDYITGVTRLDKLEDIDEDDSFGARPDDSFMEMLWDSYSAAGETEQALANVNVMAELAGYGPVSHEALLNFRVRKVGC